MFLPVLHGDMPLVCRIPHARAVSEFPEDVDQTVNGTQLRHGCHAQIIRGDTLVFFHPIIFSVTLQGDNERRRNLSRPMHYHLLGLRQPPRVLQKLFFESGLIIMVLVRWQHFPAFAEAIDANLKARLMMMMMMMNDE